MAQFRASIQGQRGATTRLGTKKSGINAIVNGWDQGVTVTAKYDEVLNQDVFEVRTNGGTNGTGERKLITIIGA